MDPDDMSGFSDNIAVPPAFNTIFTQTFLSSPALLKKMVPLCHATQFHGVGVGSQSKEEKDQ